MNIFWAKYEWRANGKQIATRYAAIAAASKATAKKRAERVKPEARMVLPADARQTQRVEILSEDEMIDETEARVYLATPIGPEIQDEVEAREAALAETLNLVKEIIDDQKYHVIIEEEGEHVVCLRLADLKNAVNRGAFANDYAIVGDNSEFLKARRQIIGDMFGVVG